GEVGRIGDKDVAFVPAFDIPSDDIDQAAREFRFNNGSTTDDHLMHIVGYADSGGEDWFLVKDSWRTAWDGQFSGYYFFHEDYIKLKVLAYMVHRDGVPNIKQRLSSAQ
ncbi:MAG: peptidase C1, partial [Caldithrix sp.]|nr:peptidase C1 [Caldithrix sp.]